MVIGSSRPSRASAARRSISSGIEVKVVDQPMPVALQEPDPEHSSPALEFGPRDVSPRYGALPAGDKGRHRLALRAFVFNQTAQTGERLEHRPQLLGICVRPQLGRGSIEN